jgi:tRNA(Arg) A34 adenosine deaminase TadA
MSSKESRLESLDHDFFMALALQNAQSELARGGRPIFCLVVQPDGQVVGQGGNTVSRDMDPSAHAEVNAIRSACASLKTLDLSGSTLYTPMEPCPMCLSTILEAKISAIVLGARHKRVGRTDLGNYSVEALLGLLSRRIDVVAGVRESECEELRLVWKRRHGETQSKATR